VDSYKKFLEAHSGYLYRLEQNAYVLESIGLIYMDTPKTAGTSIKTKLAQLESGYVAPKDSLSLESITEMFIHDSAVNPLRTIAAFTEQDQSDMLFTTLWKRVCVVRNPYNRLFSAWFSKVLLRQPGFIEVLQGYDMPERISGISEVYSLFESFVAHLREHGCASDPHWDLQTKLLFHDDIAWDKVFRYESLEDELTANSALFGSANMELGKLNVSGFSPDWDLISEKTKEMIVEIYEPDFDVYDYRKIPPPRRDNNNTLVEYINAVAGRNDRIDMLLSSRKKLQLEIERLHQECDDLLSRIHDVEERSEDVSLQIKSILNSRSWKLTSPLRKLYNAFRKL
jgi:hypothetical protein